MKRAKPAIKKVKKEVRQEVLRELRKEGKPSKSKSKGSLGHLVRTAGGVVGGFLGGPSGARIGADASAYVAKIMGLGSYRINHNTLLTETGPPSFSSNGDSVIITHREYIQDIQGSINFSNKSWVINPGNVQMFPWLAQIAQNFEEYKFEGLVVEYKSTSASALNSTNTALGTVIMATEYNSLDDSFADKRSMEQYEFVCSTAPSHSAIHPVECKVGENAMEHLYCTAATSTSTVAGDPRLYFKGNFQLATVGMQAVSTIGELWVSYQVKLFKPRLSSTTGANLLCAHYTGTSSGANSPFTTAAQHITSNLALTFPTSSVFTIPTQGRYMIYYGVTSVNGFSSLSTAMAAGAGTTYVNFLVSPTGVSNSSPRSYLNTTSFYDEILFVDIAAGGGQITGPQFTATSCYYDLVVSQIPSGLSSNNLLDFGKGVSAIDRINHLELLFKKLGRFDDKGLAEPQSPPPPPLLTVREETHSQTDPRSATDQPGMDRNIRSAAAVSCSTSR